jgi:hypothetical protein
MTVLDQNDEATMLPATDPNGLGTDNWGRAKETSLGGKEDLADSWTLSRPLTSDFRVSPELA